jgi:hypothetical protein
MDQETDNIWEMRIRASANAFQYPPTPDVERLVKRDLLKASKTRWLSHRKVAWLLIGIFFLFFFGVLAVPPVRAAVLEYLQLGGVRILRIPPTPTNSPAVTPPALIPTGSALNPTQALSTTPEDLVSIQDLDGETSLQEVRSRIHVPIRLPSYPTGLGPPDHIYLQQMDGWVVIFVWTVTDRPDKVLMSLHMISEGSFAVEKVYPLVVQETSVNGRPALWTTGPYIVRLFNGDVDLRRLVEGHVLIWVENRITYRLETDLPLEEALRIAGSLK